MVIASRREAVLGLAADEINATLDSERVLQYAFDIRDHGQIESLVNHVFGRWQSLIY